MITKEDCFSYRKAGIVGRCIILNTKTCDKCKFYKTVAQFKEDLKRYPPDYSKLTSKSLLIEKNK